MWAPQGSCTAPRISAPSLLLPPRTAKLKQVWVSYRSSSCTPDCNTGTTNRRARGQEGGRPAECRELDPCPSGQRAIPPAGPSGRKAPEGPLSKSDAEAQSHAADNASTSRAELFLRGTSHQPPLAPHRTRNVPKPVRESGAQSEQERGPPQDLGGGWGWGWNSALNLLKLKLFIFFKKKRNLGHQKAFCPT